MPGLGTLFVSGFLNSVTIPGGCQFHPTGLILSAPPFPVPSGFDISFSIPSNPALAGVEAYLQWVIQDGVGPYPGGVSFTNGLRLRFGL